MSELFVVRLESVGAADVEVVGGKAAGLGELIQAGFPVPAGLCLTTAAFRLALEPHQDALDEILSAGEGAGAQRRQGPSAWRAAADAVSQALGSLAVPPP